MNRIVLHHDDPIAIYNHTQTLARYDNGTFFKTAPIFKATACRITLYLHLLIAVAID